MYESGFLYYLAVSLMSASIVCAVLSVYARIQKRRSDQTGAPDMRVEGAAIFLFESGVLTDANTVALECMSSNATGDFGWNDLAALYSGRFACFPSSQYVSEDSKNQVLRARDPSDPGVVTIDHWGTTARVSVAHSTNAAPSNLDLSWTAIFDAPNPIWQTDDAGSITWRNAAYDAFATKLGRDDPTECDPIFDVSAGAPDAEPVRTGVVDIAHDQTYWFDVIKVVSQGRTMHYATDANAIVNAEIAQRNFVQTLTKTFAQLSIGLAIFDRNRQLALFNPALIDLTVLPADFLSGRPSLLSFFDRLRENRVMPEPKNYASWREQIAELVVAASDGRYAETWTLPSGLTYRVTGRPHPDGAIAFLFEDISAEISLTRRFRADLELGHSVIDALDSAVAVFTPSGELTICNKAYRELWQSDPDTSFAEYTLRDALPVWKADAEPSEIWPRLHKEVLSHKKGSAWSDMIHLKSGRQMTVCVTPLAQGATMVQFASLKTAKPRGIAQVPAL